MTEAELQAQNIKLQPPGAGLPLLDWLVARYYIFPFHICGKTKEEAIDITVSAGQDCLDIVRELGADANKQVLIRPLKGLEDSSRNWSAAMTIEHLIIVHGAMLMVMQTLCAHKTIDRVVGTADVKPTGAMSADEVIAEYDKMLKEYPAQIAALSDMKNKNYKHKHPWFGAMSADQWMCTNAQHTRIHRQQLKEIRKALS